MNLNAIASVLAPCVRVGENIGLIGQPGVGKTEFVREFVKTLRASDIRPELAEPGDEDRPVRFVSIATTTKESVDFAGLPQIENGRTTWCPPSWVPTGNEACVVFLDEFPQAELPTQLAAQKMIDRDLDGVAVSPRAIFIVAGNRPEDNAGANEIPTHLRNRFTWFNVEADALSWCNWADANDVAPEVVEFIRFRPEMLNRFDATSDANAFATPRSVTRFAAIYRHCREEQVMSLAAAKLGAEWAAEFSQYLALYKRVPSVKALLDNPDSVPIPSEFGIQLALASAIVRHLKADKSRLSAVTSVVQRIIDSGAKEVAAKCLRDIAGVAPEMFQDPKAAKLFAAIAPMLKA